MASDEGGHVGGVGLLKRNTTKNTTIIWNQRFGKNRKNHQTTNPNRLFYLSWNILKTFPAVSSPPPPVPLGAVERPRVRAMWSRPGAWSSPGWLWVDFCGSLWVFRVGKVGSFHSFHLPFFDVFFFIVCEFLKNNTLLAVSYIHLKWNLVTWIFGFDFSIGFLLGVDIVKLCISTFCASRRASVCRVVVVMPRSSNSQASFKAQSLLSCIEFQEKTSLLKLLNKNMKQMNKQKIVRKKQPNSKNTWHIRKTNAMHIAISKFFKRQRQVRNRKSI